jgi:hypothetical protein
VNIDHLKKPTKKQALEMIQDLGLSNTIREEVSPEIETEKHYIQELLRYFSPTISQRNPKSPMEWISKAVAGKEDQRHYLQFIFVKEGVAYASNGCCIAWIDTDLEGGFYDPLTLEKVELDYSYPDIAEALDYTMKTLLGACGLENFYLHDEFVIKATAGEKSCYINRAYFNQVATVKHSEFSLYESVKSRVALSGTNEFGNFLLMTINLPKN